MGNGQELLDGLVKKGLISRGKTAVVRAREFYPAKLSGHAKKHAAEVGAPSAKSYQQMAIDFANSQDAHYYSGVNRRGEFIKLDAKTGRFLVVERTGMIKTFFIPNDPKFPTPLDYFVNELATKP